MASFIHKNIRRFRFAFAGIYSALKEDSSFKIQFYLGSFFFLCFGYITRPLSESEILFLGLAWILVLITELQNSSFEAALDRIHPEEHEHIGKSKDMAAGAVLIAAFFALAVVVVITANRIF